MAHPLREDLRHHPDPIPALVLGVSNSYLGPILGLQQSHEDEVFQPSGIRERSMS